MERPNSSNPFWRQGDIYFVKLDEEIDAARATPVKNGIIAKGETTGHAHRVSPSSIAAGALLSLVGRSMFLRSPEAGTTIVHDEHGPIRASRRCLRRRSPAGIRRPSLAAGARLSHACHLCESQSRPGIARQGGLALRSRLCDSQRWH